MQPISSAGSKQAPSSKGVIFGSFQLGLIIFGTLCFLSALKPSFAINRLITSLPGFAQLLAFPQPLGAIISVSCISLAYLRRRDGFTLLRTTAYLVWMLVGIAFILFPFGISTVTATSAPQATRLLTLVTFNSAGNFSPDDLREIAMKADPDIIILPETETITAEDATTFAGFEGTVFGTQNSGFTGTYQGQVAPTSMIIKKNLGSANHSPGPPTSFGTVAIEFDDRSLPLIVGVHAAPPLSGLIDEWHDDLARVVEFGETSTRPTIIAGDFNATTRHASLAARHKLIDSQEYCNTGYEGTWPSWVPAALRTPIDHVFLHAELEATACNAFVVGTSDHLAYSTAIKIPR